MTRLPGPRRLLIGSAFVVAMVTLMMGLSAVRSQDEPAESPASETTPDPEALAAAEQDFHDAYHRAKAAQVREAEARVAWAREQQIYLDRQRDRGIVSPQVQALGRLAVVEAEAQLAIRMAELKEVEFWIERARHRGLREDPHDRPDDLAQRVETLESRLQRLQAQVDALRQDMVQLELRDVSSE